MKKKKPKNSASAAEICIVGLRAVIGAKLSTERLRRARTSVHISPVCLTLPWFLIGQRILCIVQLWREPCTGASPVSLLSVPWEHLGRISVSLAAYKKPHGSQCP